MIELLLIFAAVACLSILTCLIIDDFRCWRERWRTTLFFNAISIRNQKLIETFKKLFTNILPEAIEAAEQLGITVSNIFKQE